MEGGVRIQIVETFKPLKVLVFYESSFFFINLRCEGMGHYGFLSVNYVKLKSSFFFVKHSFCLFCKNKVEKYFVITCCH